MDTNISWTLLEKNTTATNLTVHNDPDLPTMNLSLNGRDEPFANTLKQISEVLVTQVSAIICVFGILGNILTLIILSKRLSQRHLQSMERSSQEGLMALSVSDMLFCLVALPGAINNYMERHPLHPIYVSKNFALFYTVYVDFVVNMFVTSSTLLTLTMAVQRYMAICYPIKARIRNNCKRSRILIVCTFLVSLVLNLPRIWKRKIIGVKCTYNIIKTNCTGIDMLYSTRMGYLMEERTVKTSFMVVHFLFSVVIPLVILSFCNCKLIQALRKSNQLRKRHSYVSVTSGMSSNGEYCIDHTQRITLTLIIIIIMFILLVVPAEVTNFVRDFYPGMKTLQPLHTNSFITALVNTLQKVNFAFNFILYCVVNQNFRKTLWDVMIGKAIQQFGTANNKLHRPSLKSDMKFHSMDFQMTLIREKESEFQHLDVVKQTHSHSIQNLTCLT